MKGVEDVAKKVESWLDTDSAPNAVDLLKQDHRKVEVLFMQFTKARTADRRKALVDEILTELSIHATVEEDLVYPLLEEMPRKEDKAMEAVEEHHVVKMLMADIADTKISDEKLNAKMKVLQELVKHHVKEEEWQLLPALKRSDNDLDRLGNEIRARKDKLMKAVSRGGGVGKNKDSKARSTTSRKAKTGKRSAAGAAGGGSARRRKSVASKKAQVRKVPGENSAKRRTSNRRKAGKRAA